MEIKVSDELMEFGRILLLFFWPGSLSGIRMFLVMQLVCRALAQKSLSMDLLWTNPGARMKLDSEKKKERRSVSFVCKDHQFTFIVISQVKKQEQLAKCLMMECPGRNMRSIRSRWWRKSKFESLLKNIGLEIKLTAFVKG